MSLCTGYDRRSGRHQPARRDRRHQRYHWNDRYIRRHHGNHRVGGNHGRNARQRRHDEHRHFCNPDTAGDGDYVLWYRVRCCDTTSDYYHFGRPDRRHTPADDGKRDE